MKQPMIPINIINIIEISARSININDKNKPEITPIKIPVIMELKISFGRFKREMIAIDNKT